MENVPKKEEKVLVVGVKRPGMSREYAEASLVELISLVDTAGGVVARQVFQELKILSASTLIGSGKVDQIADDVKDSDIGTVIFDDELTPAQNRNLNAFLGVKVLDRTALILDIFAERARTKEGKLQVELAQMQYLLPRLKGSELSMSQQAGYIGNRGPGETKLEVDRRRVRERIARLRKDITKVMTSRSIHRKKREGVSIPTVSLVGYTNVGKSTLLNRLTGSDVFVENKLFATLDPTVRHFNLKSGREILVADTVGFIRRLPHQLVDAFRATFEEVAMSDLLVHLVDVSADDAAHQQKTVLEVLAELGLDKKPIITVFNKCDVPKRGVRLGSDAIEISAAKGSGIDKLLDEVDRELLRAFQPVTLRVPYAAAGILDDLYALGNVEKIVKKTSHILVKVSLPVKQIGRYSRYVV